MLIKIEGYGVETFAGTVPFATYEYFKNEDIDLGSYNEFLYDSDESPLDIPQKHNFAIERGSSLIDIDDLWGMQGAVLDEENLLVVENDYGDEWECDLSLATLQSHGIKLVAISNSEQIINELPSQTTIVVSTQTIEGTVFGDDDIDSDDDFDPKQLEIHYHDSGNELVIKSIIYAEQELSNVGIDADTTSREYEWIIKP